MIKQVKGYKSFWVGTNKIGITVSYPNGKFVNVIVNLDDFTVEESSYYKVGTVLPNVEINPNAGKIRVDEVGIDNDNDQSTEINSEIGDPMSTVEEVESDAVEEEVEQHD